MKFSIIFLMLFYPEKTTQFNCFEVEYFIYKMVETPEFKLIAQVDSFEQRGTYLIGTDSIFCGNCTCQMQNDLFRNASLIDTWVYCQEKSKCQYSQFNLQINIENRRFSTSLEITEFDAIKESFKITYLMIFDWKITKNFYKIRSKSFYRMENGNRVKMTRKDFESMKP